MAKDYFDDKENIIPYKPPKIDVFLAKAFPAHLSESTFLTFVTLTFIGMSIIGRMKR